MGNEIKLSNEIKLMENASRYKLSSDLTERLVSLINKSKEEDKLRLAIHYAHSITKCEIRGSRWKKLK